MQSKWDDMADWYDQFSRFAFQGTYTCLTMVDCSDKSRVLEVGCGPGLHSIEISKSYIKGLLVSSDFSPKMVAKMQARYAQSDLDSSIDCETDHTKSQTS